MKERGIGEDEVASSIRNADESRPSVKGRTNAYKFINGRYLRITFKEEIDHILLVTAVARRKRFQE